MSTPDTAADRGELTSDDLVPDEPLRGAGKNPIADSQDLLHHRVIARKVAELATSANGKVNIALFGPWGAGKSSFNELLKEELKVIDPKARHITFDAWKNAGEGFRTNFLSELARQIPHADDKISDQLFQATTKVALPFANVYRGDHGGWRLAGFGALLLTTLFLLLPLGWTVIGHLFEPVADFMGQWGKNVVAWSGFAASSTFLLVVIAGLLEMSKVTVSRSTPSHVAQFSVLFDKLLNTDSKRRYVIFIDELDRCGKKDVMATLEGLRTFLGHDRCVFVVAFDRDAIATTIAEQMQHSVPTQAVSPYYRTSGEYLDKIFQFQLALPPQPAHTFRRYALSLVRERGGVWAQLRSHQDGLLDRVVTVLSPMHLASPRRTKVLLNDFAVNARVFGSLGFDWMNRAEEIAVLTVLQTEFPNLMADIERAPSLMRFLYREETPTRPEIVELLSRYRMPDATGDGDEAELDRVVLTSGTDNVARDLQTNLGRYLRRLREMGAPEPRADLIMMHSDGNLLHFDDPGVYHEVLLAADTPRKDVVKALSLASPEDRAIAIDHILEQAEPESAQIASSLRVLAGELAAELPTMSAGTASNLRSGMFAGLAGHTQTSMEGYARAIAVAYTDEACSLVIAAAATHSDDALGAVISRFVNELTPADWESASPSILTRILGNAVQLPGAAADVLRRTGQDPDAELDGQQIAALADSLSAAKPAEVEPAAATAAARQEAEAQNAQLLATFEEQRESVRAATEAITEIWPQLPVDGAMRSSLLAVLRAADDDSTWHLDKHDQLIADDIAAGDIEAANAHLLTAIAQKPHLAAARWRTHLSNDASVDARRKATALDVVVHRATNATDVTTRTNGADNAFRLASLPSDPVPATGLLAKIAGAIAPEWDEYTDDRFEYLSTLLDAIDLLGDPDAQTTAHRARLYLDAVTSAQSEEASVEQILQSLKALPPAEAGAVANSLFDAALWEEDYPEHSTRVLLAAQEVATASGEPIDTLPAIAVTQLTDPAVKKQIADAWLPTAPPTTELKSASKTVTFSSAAWQKFGERVTGELRAQAWELLHERNATLTLLRALSLTGQPQHVYEQAAAAARDAATKPARESAIDRFLVLPVNSDAAGIAQALVKTMAAERKRTELALGLRLIKAYHVHWSKGVIAGIKPSFTPWAETGESYIAQRDITWLAQEGYIVRKSTIWEQFFGRKK